MPTVLVTGAGRGIGLATTNLLARAGWEVYAGARSDEHLDALTAIDHVHPLRLEITDPHAIAGLAGRLPDKLDAVVNNAGVVVHGPVEGITPSDIDRQMSVNVTGQVAVTQAVLPAIRAAKGRVVFISSVSGRVSTPMTGIYNASKFALEGLADAWRVELRPWGIDVVLVEPGTTRTDIWTDVVEDFQSMGDRLSEANRLLYAKQLRAVSSALPRLQRTAVPPARVAKVIHTALTAPRPRRRYMCDTASRLQVIARAITPAPVTDAVLSAAITRSPRQ